MDHSSRDDQYVIRRNKDYDTYNPSRPNNRFSTGQNSNQNNRDSYYTYAQQRSDNDRPIDDRRFRDSRYENDREHHDIPTTNRSRIFVDNNHETTRRNNPSDQIQRSPPRVNYTINQPQQIHSGNQRSLVIDISITIGTGRNPQISATTSNFRPRSPPIRSTAVIEDLGYIDIDIRSPSRTARLATDGIIRPPPLKQSTNHSNENNK